MYVTEPPTVVTALDLRTGRPLWRWERTLPADLQTIGFGKVNRGVAALGDMVYVGTLDAHLVALDARSGAVRWDAAVADYKSGHCITVAPLAIDGKSSPESAAAKPASADSSTPMMRKPENACGVSGPSPARRTRQRFLARRGFLENRRRITWVTGSYDADLKLIYWGVGNPGPDWNGDPRPGDNLYTCSLVALDAETGKLRWHFQFTPHDTHDWDATEIPVLLDAVVRRKAAQSGRHGQSQCLFLFARPRRPANSSGTPYAKQTWAKGIDDSGRPVVLPDTSRPKKAIWSGRACKAQPIGSARPTIRCAEQFYVSVREMSSYYYKGEAEYKPGTFFAGGGERALSGDDAWGAIRALDVATGKRNGNFVCSRLPGSA